MDDLKKCPDCAEAVRAEARVCRFCGYRFDGTRRSDGGVLGGLVRRSREAVPLPELLAGWGAELATDEVIGYFGYCKLDASHGFLLVTSARVAFFAGRGGNRVIDWPLAAVDVRAAGGWRGRGLALTGPDRTVALHRFDSRRALADVAARLRGAPIA
jgi:hypothetical protein